MRCLSGLKFTMMATVLNDYAPEITGDLEEEVKGGHWETYQDEDTNAIRQRWVEDVTVPNLPGTTPVVNTNRFDIECLARGFNEVGFRSSANTESFENGYYRLFEAIEFVFPSKYVLNKRQYVTNIRGRNKQILWLEEETGQPTVFEVQGVTPRFDPLGRHVDNLTVLKRAAIQ